MRLIKYPKVRKTCLACSTEFETPLGSKREKESCSRGCANSLRIVPGWKEGLKEWHKAYAKEYRRTRPEWARTTQKRARTRLRERDPERLIWMETKKRAHKRGIPFNLGVTDIVIPKVCPILGIELSLGRGRVHDGSPSLDRIVPELGYTKGNCFIISAKANRMKQENTLETFEKIITYIKERLAWRTK